METQVLKAKSGDSEAFALLIKENEASLYRVARSYFTNEADIKDAVQDAVIACWEKLGTLREPAYFKTWLIRILINRCCRMLKDRKRFISMEELPEGKTSVADHSNLEFEDMMQCLSEKNRIVMALFYGEDMSLKDISSLLKISENSVKQRLHRGRQELKEKYFDL